jgi:hypothetical protein
VAGRDEALAPWVWRAVVALPAAIVCGGIGLALLLAAGLADPALPGPVLWARPAPAGECLDVVSLSLPAPQAGWTLEVGVLSRNHAAWGVALTGGQESLAWEVLPPGYYRHAGRTVAFHHVQAGANRLRLDLLAGGESGDRWRLWLNRERAVDGALPAGELGWRLTGGEGVCLQWLAVYGQP